MKDQGDTSSTTGPLSPLLHPRENPHLFGHDEAEETFLHALKKERLPHAWLITGPKGVGKASLAYRIARFIFTRPLRVEDELFSPEISPSGLGISESHPIFQQIASGGYPDLVVLERGVDAKTGKRKKDILVDDVRRIQQFFTQTSSLGGWRVAIIDSADEMNRNAANALLKLLEEPPPYSLLLLVAHLPGKLLPTIRSRCRTLRLQALNSEAARTWLKKTLPNVPAQKQEVLLRLGKGCPGYMRNLAEEEIYEIYEELLALLSGLPRIDTLTLHGLGDRLNKAGAESQYEHFMALLTGLMERLIKWKTLGPQAASISLEIPEGEQALFSELSHMKLEAALDLLDRIRDIASSTQGLSLNRKHSLLAVIRELELVTA